MNARQPLFRDRLDAGRQLAGALHRLAGLNPLVLGVPNGGVPVAAVVARELDGQLDLVPARTAGLPGPDVHDRVVVVVDDGLAAGAALVAALRSLRARGPRRLLAAVPVGAQDALRAVAHEADEVACVYAPEDFRSVGEHYLEYPQVGDEEVWRLLHDGCGAVPRRGGAPAGGDLAPR